jgi:hypothetical protein
MGFELKTEVFKRPKEICAQNRAATVLRIIDN